MSRLRVQHQLQNAKRFQFEIDKNALFLATSHPEPVTLTSPT